MITARYPIDKQCLILNSTNKAILEKKFGKSFEKLQRHTHQGSVRSTGLSDFIDKKIGELAFPSYAIYQASDDYHRKRFEAVGKEYDYQPLFHIENGCIIELPMTYDCSNDLADAMERKMNFLDTMKKALGEEYKEENFEKHVDFGSYDFSYINELLEFLHKEFKQYYSSTGFLSVFLDYKDEETYGENKMINYPYPKAFFLSEIETHLQTGYNLNTDELYVGLLDNMYIEGRYWDRYYEVEFSETNFRKKPTSMNYKTMVNLVKQDFKEHFALTRRNDENPVLPVYFDYRKELPQKAFD
jgi:hypothetical protein